MNRKTLLLVLLLLAVLPFLVGAIYNRADCSANSPPPSTGDACFDEGIDEWVYYDGAEWRCTQELNGVINPLCPPYNAKGDWAKYASDGAINSGTALLTSTGQSCVAADVGKRVEVKGAAAAGATLFTAVQSCSGVNYTLAANAGTTVSGADWTMGTDDQAALIAAGTAAINGRLILPPDKKFYTREIIVITGTVADNQTVEVTGGGELVLAGDCVCSTAGSDGFLVIKQFHTATVSGITLNGQSDILDIATTTQRLNNLTLTNNQFNIVTETNSTKATSYGYRFFNDATNPLKKIDFRQNTTDGVCLEGGVQVNGDAGGFAGSIIDILYNDMNCPVSHLLPAIQGTDPIIFEPGTGATGTVDQINIIGNRAVAGNGDMDAVPIFTNPSTSDLLIRTQNINYNTVIGNEKVQTGLITADAGDRDVAGDVGATIRIIGNDLYPAATPDNSGQGMINVLGPASAPANRQDSLFIHDNVIHVGLADVNDCAVRVNSYVESASFKNNVAVRAAGGGTPYTCGFLLQQSIGRMSQSGNIVRGPSNSTDQEFILTDAKTYGLAIDETLWIRRPRLDNGDGFEIGSFTGATTGVPSGCMTLATRWNHTSKLYQICASQVGLPAGYRRMLPSAVSRGNNHDYELLIEPNDANILRLRGIQVAATADDFHMGITPLTPAQDGDFIKYAPLSTDLGATALPIVDMGQMQDGGIFVSQAALLGNPPPGMVTLYVSQAADYSGGGGNDCYVVARQADGTEVGVTELVLNGPCP